MILFHGSTLWLALNFPLKPDLGALGRNKCIKIPINKSGTEICKSIPWISGSYQPGSRRISAFFEKSGLYPDIRRMDTG